MDPIFLVLALIALILGVIAYRHPKKLHMEGLRIGWQYIPTILPRIVMAVLVSGFFSVILPTDLVGTYLGKESGVKGILIGSLVGGFIPGGPIISFPIVVVLFKAGAGIPQLIALVTAWSVFAFHRIIAFEIPLMGFRFAMVRMLSSISLPPLAGILAILIGIDL